MPGASDIFFKQYDLVGRRFLDAQRSSPQRDHRRAFRARLPRALRAKRVLDVGCGYGHDLADLAQRGARVYGIDPSNAMIALACQLHPGLHNLSVQPVRHTTFPDRFFDLVISIYAIHNEPNLEPAFREIHRILQPGGVFLYVVQHPLFAFQAKRTPDYHRRQIYRFTIPDMAPPVTLRQPTHTFSDYFNDFVLARFDLQDFAEGREPVPMWFLAKFRRR
jgi:SAM-dependent methyltransferase